MSDLVDGRLIVFRQMKKEIRGSSRHLLIGIDVAKNKHNAFSGIAYGDWSLKTIWKALRN